MATTVETTLSKEFQEKTILTDADFTDFVVKGKKGDFLVDEKKNDPAPISNQGSTVTRTDAKTDATQTTPADKQNQDASNKANNRKQRYVTPKDFELLKVIGLGSFGKVLQVRNKVSKQILAMKIISKRLLNRRTNYIENIRAERDILTKVDHPFVVTMHASFMTREKLFIIMDFLAGGELFLRMGREGVFLEGPASFYLGETILALEHLHGRGILHRDLKPENILLSADGHICLTDFGLAKDFSSGTGAPDDNEWDGRARTICGTQEYMAPEMVAQQGYGKAADFWSLGCIAYEMLSGRPPFLSKKGAKDLFRKIMTERVKMPDATSSAAHILLKGLLNRNVWARLGAAKGTMFQVGGVAGLKQIAFFDGIDWEKLAKKEIEPPCSLAVDNDEDLRHFHEEFVKMTIPRSVYIMNSSGWVPRRCNSELFRGFSFVHDDFVLPERNQEEEDAYWNMVEEDGESLSECASTLYGDPAASIEPVANEKKRPPRKRKKKNKAVTPTTSEIAPSESSFGSSLPESEITPVRLTLEAPTLKPTLELPPPWAETEKKQTPVKEPVKKPPPPKPVVQSWQTVAQGKKVPKKSGGNKKTTNIAKPVVKSATTTQQSRATTTTSQSRATPIAMQSRATTTATQSRVAPGFRPAQPPPPNRSQSARSLLSTSSSQAPWGPALPTPRPTPTTMAARVQPKQAPTQASPLSPDWRQHNMTRAFSVRNMPQPPSLENDFPPPPSTANAYPVLGGAKKQDAPVKGAWSNRLKA